MHLAPFPGDSSTAAPPQAPTRSRTGPKRCGAAPGPFHGRLQLPPTTCLNSIPVQNSLAQTPPAAHTCPRRGVWRTPLPPTRRQTAPHRTPSVIAPPHRRRPAFHPSGRGLAHLWPIKHGLGKRRGAIGQEGCHPRDVTGALPGAG